MVSPLDTWLYVYLAFSTVCMKGNNLAPFFYVVCHFIAKCSQRRLGTCFLLCKHDIIIDWVYGSMLNYPLCLQKADGMSKAAMKACKNAGFTDTVCSSGLLA